eukprot:CAMPEP_0184867150 /NCGR_PEP_ID=MMETSP0580-20130426/25194_1 /TAXON_ID=1118495 /ORGANISM="Dactyliosolen fragilissimus" /LENGTH=233 /DNA_ID=CAMNT_0027367227 /DNA_START=464 /DNA_END=1165 /DNA_ORIENTATION=+
MAMNQVHSCTALDMSEDMMNYSEGLADNELVNVQESGKRENFKYICGDMRSFSSGNGNLVPKSSMDSVWILLGSMQHLLTNDDVISCFQSVSNCLKKEGTVIIELPHPREVFTMGECTRNSWEVPLEDESGNDFGNLKIMWGDDDDAFDPIKQIRDFSVSFNLDMDTNNAQNMQDFHNLEQSVPMRVFTMQEIDALGRICGLIPRKTYGALSQDVNINNEEEAFRLVCVLQKT